MPAGINQNGLLTCAAAVHCFELTRLMRAYAWFDEKGGIPDRLFFDGHIILIIGKVRGL